ncbi:molybdopterin synthase sulfur carrier subunit isoform X2 [Denticeps clupeoides]|uniref:molybdopterin synthase sulfur carrier subunit isoform X2 n=1 Tax=Denticeps clupeoides TaxID=299321 RepID=UPI0010A44FBA|nr:molybdopterin synthase sulfur carrier subunit isoform X2 [Denticeps clupeoides]
MPSEVLVLYFAKSAELTGRRSEKVTLPSELTALALWQALESRHPSLSALRGRAVLAVRQEYVDPGDQRVQLSGGDEVAVIPPLSGG